MGSSTDCAAEHEGRHHREAYHTRLNSTEIYDSVRESQR